MSYSEQELEEIGRDPVRLRAYFWRVATNMKRMAARNRTESRQTGELHPVTNYLAKHYEGQDLMHWAGVLDTCGDLILEDLDQWVDSCLEKDPLSDAPPE